MVISHPQLFFRCAGGNSCYFDCITTLASRVNGVPLTAETVGRAVDTAVDSGAVKFDWNDYSNPGNFTVADPARLLYLLTGRRYEVTWQPGNYVAAKDELEVDFWALSAADGDKGKGHFCLPDYDPLGESNTRRNGYIHSKRIFRKV